MTSWVEPDRARSMCLPSERLRGFPEDLAVFHHHGIGADDDEHTLIVLSEHLLDNRARLALGELLARLGGLGELVGLERLVHGVWGVRTVKATPAF